MKVHVRAQSTGYALSQASPGKSVVRLIDMTIAVDLDVKPQTKQTDKCK